MSIPHAASTEQENLQFLADMVVDLQSQVTTLLIERDELTTELEELRISYNKVKNELRMRELRINQYELNEMHKREVLQNSDLTAMEKLVWLHDESTVRAIRMDVCEEVVVHAEHDAAALGASTDTIRRARKSLQNLGVMQYKQHKTERKENGDFRTPVSIKFTELVNSPEKVHKTEKKHGGARVYMCGYCGSENVDEYKVRYCRCCGKSGIYKLPGLRNDFDLKAAINSIASGNDKFEQKLLDDSNNDEKPQKQDASIRSVAHTSSTATGRQGDAQLGHNRQIAHNSQKQDASTVSNSFTSTEIAPSHTGNNPNVQNAQNSQKQDAFFDGGCEPAQVAAPDDEPGKSNLQHLNLPIKASKLHVASYNCTKCGSTLVPVKLNNVEVIQCSNCS